MHHGTFAKLVEIRIIIFIIRHKNYMRVGTKPIFCFYRISQKDESSIADIIQLWQRLAAEEGLGGELSCGSKYV